MTGVPVKKEKSHAETHTEGRSRVRTGTEIGVRMLPQARGFRGLLPPPEAGRGTEGVPLQSLEAPALPTP